jgi:hypothetical protein
MFDPNFPLYDTLTDSQREKIDKLRHEKYFNTIQLFKGDPDLASSCNSEFTLDTNDVFRTDGTVNFYAGKVYYPKTESTLLEYNVGIRGASYVILADRSGPKNEWNYGLLVDIPFIDERYDEIVRQIINMKETIHSTEYYLDIWRDKVDLVENGTDICDII